MENKKLVEQLKRLGRQLDSVRPGPIIKNTEAAVQRMREVRKESSWYGRTIALEQEVEL